MIRPERSRYLQSLADELEAQANRIRNLIGDKHWATDGAYKEHLLGGVIRRHCPSGLVVARGFVVSDIDASVISREQDLLVIDNTREAPLFYEAGIVVSFPRNVVAAISVKSALGKGEVDDVVSTLNSLRTAAAHPSLEPSHIWCGAYSYTAATNPTKTYEHIANAIQDAPVVDRRPSRDVRPLGPDCIVAGSDQLWAVDPAVEDSRAITIRGFLCDGLSSAFFLGQLLSHISSLRDHTESDFARLLSSAQPIEPAQFVVQV